jgi:hypothetical protein
VALSPIQLSDSFVARYRARAWSMGAGLGLCGPDRSGPRVGVGLARGRLDRLALETSRPHTVTRGRRGLGRVGRMPLRHTGQTGPSLCGKGGAGRCGWFGWAPGGAPARPCRLHGAPACFENNRVSSYSCDAPVAWGTGRAGYRGHAEDGARPVFDHFDQCLTSA